MQSEFATGNQDWKVIVLFTDADAHEIGIFPQVGSHHEGTLDLEGVKKVWKGTDNQDKTDYLNQRTKRLLVFAPRNTKYEGVSGTVGKTADQ